MSFPEQGQPPNQVIHFIPMPYEPYLTMVPHGQWIEYLNFINHTPYMYCQPAFFNNLLPQDNTASQPLEDLPSQEISQHEVSMQKKQQSEPLQHVLPLPKQLPATITSFHFKYFDPNDAPTLTSLSPLTMRLHPSPKLQENSQIQQHQIINKAESKKRDFMKKISQASRSIFNSTEPNIQQFPFIICKSIRSKKSKKSFSINFYLKNSKLSPAEEVDVNRCKDGVDEKNSESNLKQEQSEFCQSVEEREDEATKRLERKRKKHISKQRKKQMKEKEQNLFSVKIEDDVSVFIKKSAQRNANKRRTSKNCQPSPDDS